MNDLLFVIMLHREMPINKRKIALTEGFVGYIFLGERGCENKNAGHSGFGAKTEDTVRSVVFPLIEKLSKVFSGLREIEMPEGSMAMTGHESGKRGWRETKERLYVGIMTKGTDLFVPVTIRKIFFSM